MTRKNGFEVIAKRIGRELQNFDKASKTQVGGFLNDTDRGVRHVR